MQNPLLFPLPNTLEQVHCPNATNKNHKELRTGPFVPHIILDLPPGIGIMSLALHSMLPTSKEIIVDTSFLHCRGGAMAMRTGDEIIGVEERMSYFLKVKLPGKEYIFVRARTQKLAGDLNIEVLAQIPLDKTTSLQPFMRKINQSAGFTWIFLEKSSKTYIYIPTLALVGFWQ